MSYQHQMRYLLLSSSYHNALQNSYLLLYFEKRNRTSAFDTDAVEPLCLSSNVAPGSPPASALLIPYHVTLWTFIHLFAWWPEARGLGHMWTVRVAVNVVITWDEMVAFLALNLIFTSRSRLRH